MQLTRMGKEYVLAGLTAALTTSSSEPSPTYANDGMQVCHDSIRESKKAQTFISEITVNPNRFDAMGKTYSIREAWAERFWKTRKDAYYWMCFSLNENGAPATGKPTSSKRIMFADPQHRRSIIGHLGSPKSAHLKKKFFAKPENRPVIYSIECKSDDKEVNISVFTTQLISGEGFEAIKTPIGTSLHFKIPPNHSNH